MIDISGPTRISTTTKATIRSANAPYNNKSIRGGRPQHPATAIATAIARQTTTSTSTTTTSASASATGIAAVSIDNSDNSKAGLHHQPSSLVSLAVAQQQQQQQQQQQYRNKANNSENNFASSSVLLRRFRSADQFATSMELVQEAVDIIREDDDEDSGCDQHHSSNSINRNIYTSTINTTINTTTSRAASIPPIPVTATATATAPKANAGMPKSHRSPTLSKYLDNDNTIQTEPMSPATKSSGSIIHSKAQPGMPAKLPITSHLTSNTMTMTSSSTHSTTRGRSRQTHNMHNNNESIPSSSDHQALRSTTMASINHGLSRSTHSTSAPIPAWKRLLEHRAQAAPLPLPQEQHQEEPHLPNGLRVACLSSSHTPNKPRLIEGRSIGTKSRSRSNSTEDPETPLGQRSHREQRQMTTSTSKSSHAPSIRSAESAKACSTVDNSVVSDAPVRRNRRTAIAKHRASNASTVASSSGTTAASLVDTPINKPMHLVSPSASPRRAARLLRASISNAIAPHQRKGGVMHLANGADIAFPSLALQAKNDNEAIVSGIPHRVKFPVFYDIVQDDSQCSVLTGSLDDNDDDYEYAQPRRTPKPMVDNPPISPKRRQVNSPPIRHPPINTKNSWEELEDDSIPPLELSDKQQPGWKLREKSKFEQACGAKIDAFPNLPSRHSTLDRDSDYDGQSDLDDIVTKPRTKKQLMMTSRGLPSTKEPSRALSASSEHTPVPAVRVPSPPPIIDDSPAQPRRRSSVEDRVRNASSNRKKCIVKRIPDNDSTRRRSPTTPTNMGVPSMFDNFPSKPSRQGPTFVAPLSRSYVRQSSLDTSVISDLSSSMVFNENMLTSPTQQPSPLHRNARSGTPLKVKNLQGVIPSLPDGLKTAATTKWNKDSSPICPNPENDGAPLCPRRRSSADGSASTRYKQNQAALTNKPQSTLPTFFVILEEESKRISSMTFGSDLEDQDSDYRRKKRDGVTNSAPSSPTQNPVPSDAHPDSAHSTKTVLGKSLISGLSASVKFKAPFTSSTTTAPVKSEKKSDANHWARLKLSNGWICGTRRQAEESFIQRRFGQTPAWKLREEEKAKRQKEVPKPLKKVRSKTSSKSRTPTSTRQCDDDDTMDVSDLLRHQKTKQDDPFTFQTAFLSTSSLEVSLSTEAC